MVSLVLVVVAIWLRIGKDDSYLTWSLLSPTGDQGRSGDNVQVPWSIWLLHGPDLLATALSFPRDWQAAEAEV